MSHPGTRRALLGGVGAAIAGPWFVGRASAAIGSAVADLESGLGGRIGLAALSVPDGGRLSYRARERFPMCSTFKLLLVGAVLHRIDLGRESLARPIAFGAADLLPYAPATRARLADGAMPVGDLCAAAVTLSDNTAANLLLASISGPASVTAFARSLGDGVTRLDRNEPDLNTAIPADPRDTTSPAAMLGDLHVLVLGGALSPSSCARLMGWLVSTHTGDARIRAGAPAGSRVGDKTGTGANGTANDVAVIWPKEGGPILLAVYVTGSRATPAASDRAIAQAASLACRALRRP